MKIPCHTPRRSYPSLVEKLSTETLSFRSDKDITRQKLQHQIDFSEVWHPPLENGKGASCSWRPFPGNTGWWPRCPGLRCNAEPLLLITPGTYPAPLSTGFPPERGVCRWLCVIGLPRQLPYSHWTVFNPGGSRCCRPHCYVIQALKETGSWAGDDPPNPRVSTSRNKIDCVCGILWSDNLTTKGNEGPSVCLVLSELK